MRRRDVLLAMLGSALACESKSAGSGPDPNPDPDPNPVAPVEADPLGALDRVPAHLRPAFDRAAHSPAPAPLPIDDEPPQTFADFLAERPRRPGPNQATLAILPIGEYPRGFVVEFESVRLVRSPEPELLGEFCAAWFGAPVRILAAMSDEQLEQMPAREHDGRRQLEAEAMLDWLRNQRPEDCFTVLALTLEDLYQPGVAWLFGLASIRDGVGVHSMIRYDPGFADTDARTPEFQQTILTRALRVIVHETGHMWGLRHCVHFACVMNPTAGLEDLDRLPLRLCPVCLRKLFEIAGTESGERWLGERWLKLAEITGRLGLDDDAAWFAQRAASLGAPQQAAP